MSAFFQMEGTLSSPGKKYRQWNLHRVRGFVSALTARRESDRKLLSLVTLTDASGSTQVELVGIFVQLRNTGLLEGAYCQG